MEFQFLTTGPTTTNKKTPRINNKFSKLTLTTPRQKAPPLVSPSLKTAKSAVSVITSIKNVSKKLSFVSIPPITVSSETGNLSSSSLLSVDNGNSRDDNENIKNNPIFQSSSSENSILTNDITNSDNDQTNCSRLNELPRPDVSDDNDELHTQMEKLELSSSYVINEDELIEQMNSITVLSSECDESDESIGETRSSISSEELFDIITISDSENETETVETYNVSTIESQQKLTELPSIVTRKLDHFFNNIPALDASNNSIIEVNSTSLSSVEQKSQNSQSSKIVSEQQSENSQPNQTVVSSANNSLFLNSNVTNFTNESEIFVAETSDEDKNSVNEEILPLPAENESADFCLHVTETQDDDNNKEELPDTASTEVEIYSPKLSDTISPKKRYELPKIHISTHVNIKIQIPFELCDSSNSSNCSSTDNSSENNSNDAGNIDNNDNGDNEDNISSQSIENDKYHEANSTTTDKSTKIINKSLKIPVQKQNINNFLTPKPTKQILPSKNRTIVKKKSSPLQISSSTPPAPSLSSSLLPSPTSTLQSTDNKIVLDDFAQKLLNELYQNTWKTPTVLKKVKIVSPTSSSSVVVISPKAVDNKKSQSNKEKTPKSRITDDFGQFQENIILESTRVPRRSPRLKTQSSSKALTKKTLTNKNDDDDGDTNTKNESIIGKIVPTRKKKPNQILDDSIDDEDDFSDDDYDDEDDDDDYVAQNDESSDDDCVPRRIPTKLSKEITYLDLTHSEIIPEEGHDKPNASDSDLENISKKFLDNKTTKTISRRKLFTPHKYHHEDDDDQHEIPSPKPKLPTEKIIHDILLPKNIYPILPKGKYSFLRSLDDNVPKELCHPNAWKYRQQFKTTRNLLVNELSELYYKEIFDNKLSVEIIWNKRLLKTAGCCKNRKRMGVRVSVIELSDKVITTCARLRCTLIHELCHAATWMIDGSTDGHGAKWKYWADRANRILKELPKITVCHQYEIDYKYTYKCTLCGAKSQAHSKSRKVENIRCAYCHGSIEIFANKKDHCGIITLMPLRQASTFALFVKEHYKTHKSDSKTHADVMKILSSQFSALSTEEKEQYKMV